MEWIRQNVFLYKYTLRLSPTFVHANDANPITTYFQFNLSCTFNLPY